MPRRAATTTLLRPVRLALAAGASAALAACAGHRPAPGVAPDAPVPEHASAAASAVAGRARQPVVSEADREHVASRLLLVPVAGVRATRIADSYLEGRSGGRTHFAIDIMAPRGTPVLAADAGRIWRLRRGGIGGITIYALDPEERIVYYYAHLDRYHRGLTEGMAIARGDTLGYVGTTGNAPPDAPHLHFQLAVVGPDRRYWAGVPVDPLPYLRSSERALLAARAAADDEPSEGAGASEAPERAARAGLPALATVAPARPVRSAPRREAARDSAPARRRPPRPSVPAPTDDAGHAGDAGRAGGGEPAPRR